MTWLLNLLKYLSRWKSGLKLTLTLPSGYKVPTRQEADMDEKVNKLRRLCEEALQNEDFRPHEFFKDGNNWTFCNQAVHFIVQRHTGYHEFRGLLANQMYDKMESSKEWEKTTGIWASEYARSGCIAVAAKKAKDHGHVAVIMPEKDGYSYSWKKRTPVLANVGGENGQMLCSKAFQKEPDYYILKEDKDSKEDA